MILTKEVEVKVNNRNIKHFKKLGYKDIKKNKIINVPIKHMCRGSVKEIEVRCDICGDTKILKYQNYLKNMTTG